MLSQIAKLWKLIINWSSFCRMKLLRSSTTHRILSSFINAIYFCKRQNPLSFEQLLRKLFLNWIETDSNRLSVEVNVMGETWIDWSLLLIIYVEIIQYTTCIKLINTWFKAQYTCLIIKVLEWLYFSILMFEDDSYK